MVESRINSGLEPVTGQMISCDFTVTTVTVVNKTEPDTVIRYEILIALSGLFLLVMNQEQE